ncbi:MAG: hypothetical protein IT443_13855 [Phycisphaeraceae bacterium]|nr:hypothetical protein [Phycisphaeraceae bacterium]
MLKNLTVVWCVAAVLMLTGCGKEEEKAPAASGAGNAPAQNMAQKLMGDVSDKAADLTAQLTEQFNKQLTERESQIKSLKAAAEGKANDELKKIISQLDDKVAAAKGKVEELKSAGKDHVDAIKAEITKMIGEIQTLYQDGMTKLNALKAAEVTEGAKTSTGGVTLPGSR